MDIIKIENLKVYGYHGVFQEENEKGQYFYINAILYTDTRKAGQKDELMYSTHYGEVCHFINTFVEKNTFKLIETVAEKLAEALLIEFSLIKQLDLEIRKPHAPIGLPFDSVSVKINRGWHKAYIALGSNMGTRDNYIEDAIYKLNMDPVCVVGKVSPVMETKPYGGVSQEDFKNTVLELDTLKTPFELLDTLHQIENEAGRLRSIHWGPRTLDLDIIFYDNLVYDSETLTIPHTDMKNRFFVLEPLNNIAPAYRHPIFNKTVRELLQELKEKKLENN